MSAIKTILVPIDFGEPSATAVRYAVDLAESLAAKVFLLHSFELPIVGFPDGALVATPEIANRIMNASQTALEEAVAIYRGRNVAIASLLRQGDPREVILDVAKDLEADLIVMGTHGRRGIARALIGSVTDSVVRTSSVPVLSIHADAGKRSEPRASTG